MTRRHRPSGFTLIEVVVALAISAIVVLVARSVVTSVTDAAVRVERSAGIRTFDANADQLLRALLASVRWKADSATLAGNERVATFRSWCPGAGGWKEPCEATMLIVTRDSGAVLLALTGMPDPIVLRSRFESAGLRYLESPANGGRWTDRWISPEPPFALGIVTDADTAMIPVGVTR